MKLRRELLGIVLAFSTAGIIASGVDANAYQEVYDQQEKQERKINQALSSEFISTEDQQQLEQSLDRMDQAKQSETRRSLRVLIEEETTHLSEVQKRLVEKEAQVAKTELSQLTENVSELNKKSQETFITAEDLQQVEQVKNQLTGLASVEQVAPIRTLSEETKELSNQIRANQTELIALVDDLKEANQQATDLSSKKYMQASDKEELTNNQKENSRYFDDADSIEQVKNRKSKSTALLARLQNKQEESEKDFQKYEDQSKELIKSATALLSEGDLTTEEKNQLTEYNQLLSKALALDAYTPGDLATNYQVFQTTYEQALKSSNERLAAAKKKADEEAAQKAAQEKAAQEKAAQEQAAQQAAAQAASNAGASSTASQAPAPTLSGEWYQAPDGYKFLKVESGKTYGQVKIPGNFTLITVEQAANYTPGHGNGSAKQ